MRKRTKVILAVLLALFLLLGWFLYKNWNSINAVIHSVNTTEEDTIKEIEQTKQELQEFLDKEEDITVRDLTEEESKALNEGKLTEEEVIEILTKTTPIPEKPPVKSPKPTKMPSGTKSPVTATPAPEPSSEQIVSQLIAKLYIQKSTYLNKLDNIEANVRAEFLATPKKWGTKQDAKKALLTKYLPGVASWEKTCDSVVYGIFDEIRAELKKAGKDQTVVDTMKKSSLEEKKLKKTYFINRYMD